MVPDSVHTCSVLAYLGINARKLHVAFEYTGALSVSYHQVINDWMLRVEMTPSGYLPTG